MISLFDILITFTGSKIKERHLLLQRTNFQNFQTSKLEDDAYWLATTLSWALPVTILIASIVDAAFIWIYMKHAHPWRDILSDEKEEAPKNSPRTKVEAKGLLGFILSLLLLVLLFRYLIHF